MTSNSGPVLLCYDGSDGARRAIACTGMLLPGTDAIVLHLWNSPALDGAFAEEAGAGIEMARRAAEIADEGSERARAAGLRARPLAAGVGVSWQSILAVAESEHARMVVTGSRGRTGIRGSLGSVSAGVARHARVPVLVVPPPAEDAPTPIVDPREGDDAHRRMAPHTTLLRTLAGLSGSQREDALARYVILESSRGRDLREILEDAYVENRSGRMTILALLDRHDVVEALGRDATDELRARIAAIR
jgi:nucleotide-binding universal stress UspA family protein